MNGPWSLRLPAELAVALDSHLFPGDRDEHGAVIGAAVVETSRGTRLLARKLFLATDGTDYVPGERGYRMLTAEFVRNCALECSDEGLAYLAIHCHGGTGSVAFSDDDMASHERGYPALVDILDGPPAGGLVFARNAIAGDIWLPNGERIVLAHADIVSTLPKRLHPQPSTPPSSADQRYDRQARLFGDRGQALLAAQKIVVVGAGGAGSLISEYLSRLGVGHLVVIDPESVDPTNIPRLIGARSSDLRPWISSRKVPRSVRQFGERHRRTKVDIARRVALEANPQMNFEGVTGDVTDQSVAALLVDADFIFLAADSMQARLVVNAIVHQYLIPGIQVGVKVQVNRRTGEVEDVFSVIRNLVPGQSCLWCNGLINSAQLAEEALSQDQRKVQRYVEDVIAPSVITLNALATSHAVNDYLFTVTGLAECRPLRWRKFHSITNEVVDESVRRDEGCSECSGRLGAGSLIRLPTRCR
jgi:tRNA A37 threonylcarbamoyladenosine dehydratase